MTTHRVEVVPVKLEAHPDADTLSVVRVGQWSVVVRTEDWLDKTIGAYIPPDSVVPGTAQFAFLDGRNHIKAKRLRGVVSFGMLVPAPDGAQIGDDVMADLGVTQFVPVLSTQTGGETEKGPAVWTPVYDLENWHRHSGLLRENEYVLITEKLHGTNARFCYNEQRFWCGSRTQWIIENPKSLYWRALRENPELEKFLQDNGGVVVYGEVYGWVQDLRYGAKASQINYAIFDILNGNDWIEPAHRIRGLQKCGVKMVPILGYSNYDPTEVLALASQQTTAMMSEEAPHMREGIVIEPLEPRNDLTVGRVKLKLINTEYLMK